MAKIPQFLANLVSDAVGWSVQAVDNAFMGFYAHMRQNARRLTRLGFALLPLMMLLVGSCKVSEVTDGFAGKDQTAQFRAALFPDSIAVKGDFYRPAGGYIVRAQSFVEGEPAALSRLTEKEIGYMFGKPSMERKDAEARVWQYRTESCAVDFFFYDSGENDGNPVTYVDYRLGIDLDPEAAPREEPLTERSQSKCLRRIVRGDFEPFNG